MTQPSQKRVAMTLTRKSLRCHTGCVWHSSMALLNIERLRHCSCIPLMTQVKIGHPFNCCEFCYLGTFDHKWASLMCWRTTIRYCMCAVVQGQTHVWCSTHSSRMQIGAIFVLRALLSTAEFAQRDVVQRESTATSPHTKSLWRLNLPLQMVCVHMLRNVHGSLFLSVRFTLLVNSLAR